ncbi:hypothetical protein KAR91_59540 [Candidatus Pacearchaeota archaeon]|nr:hypothetical protein [Candidatus Pacearchaeota archaeon]
MNKRNFLKLGLKAIAGVALVPFVGKAVAEKSSLKREPRTYWVQTEAKGLWSNGSRERPFRHFMQAVDSCAPGDTVMMLPGNSFPRKMKATILS